MSRHFDAATLIITRDLFGYAKVYCIDDACQSIVCVKPPTGTQHIMCDGESKETLCGAPWPSSLDGCVVVNICPDCYVLTKRYKEL